ncbi:MAG: histidinol dehydrogenase [Sphingomonadaceae bacterium]|nr:histidinol dehydrogenase [Sphingomonadaceae bacterium]
MRLQRLDARSRDFARDFAALVAARRDVDADLAADVRAIITTVAAQGDAALLDYTRRFDGHDLPLSIPLADCTDALATLDAGLRDALELAAQRIEDWHMRQRPADHMHVDDAGVRLGARWTSVDAAGVYVPGGRAAYPSSVLMNLIPARVAGVARRVMVTPTPGGVPNPLVLAAAALGGATEVWRVGGAQAIAALAHGTSSIAPVDVITGPGNAWVAEAKRQLFGRVGIDMVAGPSEILVVADRRNDPRWIAADLLSQAEHDPTSQSILICDDAAFADAVAAQIAAIIPTLATAASARASWDAHGAIILVPDLGDAAPLINALAPEHLQLAMEMDAAEAVFAAVRHAGSVFLGRMTPEAIGDYVAGPNHVLPTARSARFSSGLSVLDFMKRTSFIALDAGALGAIGPAAVALAEAEGLPAHALSVAQRL